MAAQCPDIILFDGVWTNLYTNPLEQYWTRTGRRRPAFCASDACNRGYVASWEIVKNQLFLNHIDAIFEKKNLFLGHRPARFSMSMLFPSGGHSPVKAIWFNGKLRIPLGKMILFEDKNYDSRFERELVVTIAHGDVAKMLTLDYAGGILTVEAQTFYSREKQTEGARTRTGYSNERKASGHGSITPA